MRHDKTVAGSSLDADPFDFGALDGADLLETRREPSDSEPPDFESPAQDALSTHTAEVLQAIPVVGGNPTTRSFAEQIVRGYLNGQVIEADAIEPGQFMAHFRRNLRKTAASALPD